MDPRHVIYQGIRSEAFSSGAEKLPKCIFLQKYSLKRLSFGSKDYILRTESEEWARLACLSHLGLISDPLMVSKFHNGIHDPKGQENKIYTI